MICGEERAREPGVPRLTSRCAWLQWPSRGHTLTTARTLTGTAVIACCPHGTIAVFLCYSLLTHISRTTSCRLLHSLVSPVLDGCVQAVVFGVWRRRPCSMPATPAYGALAHLVVEVTRCTACKHEQALYTWDWAACMQKTAPLLPVRLVA